MITMIRVIGKVTDRHGNSVPSARIVLTDKMGIPVKNDEGQVMGTISDMNGNAVLVLGPGDRKYHDSLYEMSLSENGLERCDVLLPYPALLAMTEKTRARYVVVVIDAVFEG